MVVTDDVPNDVPLIGGLITEAFQTPLSHVGVLTRNRGTPNMALVSARQDPRLAPFFDKLVRLKVDGGGFELREATSAEAQAFWESRRPRGEKIVPRLDTSLRGLQDLRSHGLAGLPAIGAKAAQLAELMRVQATEADCAGPVPAPPAAYAIPVVHALEHFDRSGARRLLDDARARPDFARDAQVRAAALQQVRAAIVAHPVDPTLLTQVEAIARAAFGQGRFRLRSSSNTEDLPTFSGAGLYASLSAALDDPERALADGIRTVWASLWADRAYDERELGNIDQTQVAMAVLIHRAYDGVERANGVAVSRDIGNPIYASVHYLNAQAGEASVTNPAPAVVSEAMTFAWWKTPPITYLSRSSLTSTPVLQLGEVTRIGCLMRAVAHPLRRPPGSHRAEPLVRDGVRVEADRAPSGRWWSSRPAPTPSVRWRSPATAASCNPALIPRRPRVRLRPMTLGLRCPSRVPPARVIAVLSLAAVGCADPARPALDAAPADAAPAAARPGRSTPAASPAGAARTRPPTWRWPACWRSCGSIFRRWSPTSFRCGSGWPAPAACRWTCRSTSRSTPVGPSIPPALAARAPA